MSASPWSPVADDAWSAPFSRKSSACNLPFLPFIRCNLPRTNKVSAQVAIWILMTALSLASLPLRADVQQAVPITVSQWVCCCSSLSCAILPLTLSLLMAFLAVAVEKNLYISYERLQYSGAARLLQNS